MRSFILSILFRIIISCVLAYCIVHYSSFFKDLLSATFNLSLFFFFLILLTITPDFNDPLGSNFVKNIADKSIKNFLEQRITKKKDELEESIYKYIIPIGVSTMIPLALDILSGQNSTAYNNVNVIDIYNIGRIIVATYSYTSVYTEMLTYRKIIRDAS